MTREVYRWEEPPGQRTLWHRRIEELVSPLPAEPYTVIRVQWRGPQENPDELILRSEWWWPVGGGDDHEPIGAWWIAERISGFEVLSDPTATAKAARLATIEGTYVDRWDEHAIPVREVRAILDGSAS